MKERIKALIEEYEDKLDEAVELAKEERLCNTFSQGLIKAYNRIIDDLFNVLEEEDYDED